MKGEFRVLGRDERRILWRAIEVEIGDDFDIVVREMNVALDETRQHGPASEVHDRRASRVCGSSGPGYPLALDENLRVLEWRGSGAVDQSSVLQKQGHGPNPT